MPHLLHVDASPRSTDSITRALSARYVARWKEVNPTGTVTYRDLYRSVPPLVTEDWVTAAFGPAEVQNDWTRAAIATSDALVAEVTAADVLVLGVPMHNFGVPAVFKAWIDQIVRARRTFVFDENGPRGLLTGTRAVVVRSSGSDFDDPDFVYAGKDFHTPWLQTILGFIGISDVDVISVNGRDQHELEAALRTGLRVVDEAVTRPAAA